MHAHKNLEILYISKGNGNLYTQECSVPLSKATCIALNPNISHTEFPDERGVLEHFSFKLHGLYLAAETSVPSHLNSIFCPVDHRQMLSYINEVFDELKFKEPYFDAVIETTMICILKLITKNFTDYKFKPLEHTQNYNKIAAIKDFLDNNYSSEIKISDIDKNFFISESHLNLLFKNQYDIPPKLYLLSKRVAAAQILLKNGELSITLIATLTSFSNSAYFSKMFKAHTGFTPKKYRDNLSRNTNS